MSNPQSNPRNATLFGVLAFVLALVTVLLGFYLVPSSSRGLPFGLSLSNLVIGELLLGVELARGALAPRRGRAFLGALAGVAGPIAYIGLALVLCLLALAGAPEKLLVVLHVLLLLLAVVGLVLASIVGQAAEAATGGAAPATPFLDDLKVSVREIADRASALPGSADSAKSTLVKVAEDVRFTYAGSDAASAADDAELTRLLGAIRESLAKLESSPADPAAAESIGRNAVAFRSALSRRNDAIKSRR